MKKQYDFSKAEQGKFYCKPEDLKIPVDLDSSLETFYSERARKPESRAPLRVAKIKPKETFHGRLTEYQQAEE